LRALPVHAPRVARSISSLFFSTGCFTGRAGDLAWENGVLGAAVFAVFTAMSQEERRGAPLDKMSPVC